MWRVESKCASQSVNKLRSGLGVELQPPASTEEAPAGCILQARCYAGTLGTEMAVALTPQRWRMCPHLLLQHQDARVNAVSPAQPGPGDDRGGSRVPGQGDHQWPPVCLAPTDLLLYFQVLITF